jgi:hypothetical protein
VNQKAAWRRFVRRCSRELHDSYPCAQQTRRIVCPRHRIRVPHEVFVPKTGRWIELSHICHACRRELFEQLAAEFKHAAERAA